MADKDRERQREYNRRWYQANKAEIRERKRLYWAGTKAERNERQRQYRQANPEQVAKKQLRYRDANRSLVNDRARWRRHGVSPDRFAALWAEQDAVCLGCLSPLDKKTVSIDHDHRCCPGEKSCGACVRGLLCIKCNSSLGLARDDPVILHRLADYIDAHPLKPKDQMSLDFNRKEEE